jgi:hypothetical protein
MTDEATRALGFLGTAAHHDAAEKCSQPKDMEEILSALLADAQRQQFITAENAQTRQAEELAQMKQMMMAILALMLSQQRNARRDAEIVPDVLRDPKLARFKQNRQSLSCIKTLFARQADLVAPNLRCA